MSETSPGQPSPPAPVVLVIEDEEQLMRLVLRVLERDGFEVRTAATAAEGLELFRRQQAEIDLTLLDVQLPDMGAGALLPLLVEARPDLRLILTSGADLPPELTTSMNAIGGRFLRKPFVPKALLRLVREALASGADGERS